MSSKVIYHGHNNEELNLILKKDRAPHNGTKVKEELVPPAVSVNKYTADWRHDTFY